MYPESHVSDLIVEQFVPVRIHIKEQPQMWHRFAVRWTPTVLIMTPDGAEHRRIEGYLPVDAFLAQLELGLGAIAVARKDWKTAERWFEDVVEEHPDTDGGPEALYWSGVAKYSGSHDPKFLGETARAFSERYRNTDWAKRAGVWKG